MKNTPQVISLYSGAGGLDHGFKKAGFKIKYCTDNWPLACDTLIKNKVSELIECKDIRTVDFKKIKKRLALEDVDCLIGGPPCPPYSKSRFYLKKKKRALEDESSFTLSEYFRAVKELKPKLFFFENVFGFVYKPHLDAFNFLSSMSEELGYNISYKVINSANYGVPQIRERFICIGVKKPLRKFIFPSETHFNSQKFDGQLHINKVPWVTCNEAIGDLDFPLPDDKKMQAGSKHKHLLRLVPPGENYLYFTKEKNYPNPIFKWRSRYWSFLLKLSPFKPSWTIQASHSNNMGPFHWKNRFLRINEIKRIQAFPDDYLLIGDYKTQWRLVGNAVPPLLAEVLAHAIYSQYFDKSLKNTNVNNKIINKRSTSFFGNLQY